jgi:hypothetical protein
VFISDINSLIKCDAKVAKELQIWKFTIIIKSNVFFPGEWRKEKGGRREDNRGTKQGMTGRVFCILLKRKEKG